ncbi:hypothetical protein BDZ89DRAFT_1168406 [Hymenopellis radicata]|nr:hypothetical protein BDZ89DRAFT_1168406 [Hymenopellis radicata]
MASLHIDITGFQRFDIDLKKAPLSPFYTKFSDLDEKQQRSFALCSPSDEASITSSSSDNDSHIASARSSILSSSDSSNDEDLIELFKKKASLLESQRFEYHITKPLEDFDCTPTLIEFEDGSLQHSRPTTMMDRDIP